MAGKIGFLTSHQRIWTERAGGFRYTPALDRVCFIFGFAVPNPLDFCSQFF